jgi:hypothetical protein
MKKLLAVVAMVAISGSFAKAEDKGTEFKFGGQLRERFSWENNPTFLGSSANNESHFVQRNQFHVNAISGDKYQAYFNLLHTAMWGATSAVPANQYPVGAGGVPNNSNSGLQNNAVQVHEAWLWWKMNDMASLRAGRMSSTWGDGYVVSKNDWLDNPYNFEGVMSHMTFDFMDLDFGGAVIADQGVGNSTTPANIGNATAIPNATTAVAANTDAQTNMYAIYASIKNMPEVLKTVDFGVIQLNGDTGVGGTAVGASGIAYAPAMSAGNSGNTSATAVSNASTAGAYGLTTITTHLKGDVAMVDYRLDAAYQTGKQKGTITNVTGAVAPDVTFTASMVDLEAGFNFPEFMKARVSAGYHQDTGNDSTDATQNHAYQPLFYEQHETIGYSDFFDFGNLTDIYFKVTVQPEETCTYGILVNLASRSTTNAAYTPGTAGGANYFINPGTVGNGTATASTAFAANNDKTLGTEVDLFAKHDYGHGFSIYAQAGYLSLGQYFKQNTAAGTAPSLGNGFQLLGQLAYNF